METGIYLTVYPRLIQLFKFLIALKLLFEKNKEEHNAEGDVTSFASLFTVLAATIYFGYAL